MPTLVQIRTAVDNRLTTLWTIIQTRQDAYLITHGKFFQGKRTRTLDIANTGAGTLQTAAGDLLTDHPTDQAESWHDILPELDGLAIEMVLWIDTYDGPLGKGYQGTVRVIHNGTIYQRSAQVGSESWRAYAWQVVDV